MKTKGKVVFDDNSVLTIQDIEDVVAYENYIDIKCTDSKILLSLAKMKYVEFERNGE